MSQKTAWFVRAGEGAFAIDEFRVAIGEFGVAVGEFRVTIGEFRIAIGIRSRSGN